MTPIWLPQGEPGIAKEDIAYALDNHTGHIRPVGRLAMDGHPGIPLRHRHTIGFPVDEPVFTMFTRGATP